MANTQVFTFGLGVTVINPLGQAIDLLRRDVERLRRQADGTRLGRLVGEVIRLGLELGKVGQVERQLALDQEQQHEDQITQLADEVEAVERLRQHYLMLDRVIAGLARLKPLQARLTLSVLRVSTSVTQTAAEASAGKQPKAVGPAQAPSPEVKVALARGAVVAAGLGLTALAGRRVTRKVTRQQPDNTQRRIARVAGKQWQAHRVDAIGKVGKALIEGERGEEKAQGVGAAVGEVGGRLLGAVLPRLTKSRLARKHGAKAGAYLGEVFGKWGAGKLYAWVTQAATAQPATHPDSTPAQEAAQDTSALPDKRAYEPLQQVLANGAVVAAGLGVTALAGRRVARAVIRQQPLNTQRRITRIAGKEWQAHRVDAIGKVGQALVEGESGEKKAQGVGAALGEVGGRVLGAVLPRLTKSRLARKHGAEAGAYLGRAFGEVAGGGLFNWVTQAPEPKPAAQEAPAAMEPDDSKATPQATGQMPETVVADAQGLPALLATGASRNVPGIGKLLKKVPGAALLDASLQMVQTYNSEGTPAQKMEGYGSAAGGLGGTLAGAAAGAAIGSVVPVIGTAIGGLVGGVLGGMGGESVGGWLGRTVASVTGSTEPIVQVNDSEATPAQKMEGYGSAAGGLGGTLVGAAAGVAIGSVLPVIGTAIGGVLGGMGGESAGGWLGQAVAAVTGNTDTGASKDVARPPGQVAAVQAREGLPGLPPAASVQPSQAVTPPIINQQFTFTANMPVTFNNSLDDPTTLQQLEAIARRMLDDLMRQARSVQMADQPQP